MRLRPRLRALSCDLGVRSRGCRGWADLYKIKIMTSVELFTDRLWLRPFQLEDLDELAVLAANTDVMRFIGTGPESRDQVRSGIDRAIARWREQGMSWWTVRHRITNEFVGRCCLQRSRDLPEMEMGYAVRSELWRMGYGREMVARVLQYGFEVHKCSSIIALTVGNNLASRALLERCGFSENEIIRARNKDLTVYRTTQDAFKAAAAVGSLQQNPRP